MFLIFFKEIPSGKCCLENTINTLLMKIISEFFKRQTHNKYWYVYHTYIIFRITTINYLVLLKKDQL